MDLAMQLSEVPRVRVWGFKGKPQLKEASGPQERAAFLDHLEVSLTRQWTF